jgi:acyl transferase domain-containing protein
VAIAAINSPGSVVVSGDRGAVESVVEHFQHLGRRVSWLRVSHAFHSPLIDPVLAQLREAVAGLTFRPPRIPLVSTVTGRPVGVVDAEYWVRQARQAVRFADAVTTMHMDGVTRFVEIGPDTVLTPLVAATVDAVAVGTLRRGGDEVRDLLTAVAPWVDWHRFYAGTGARRVDLPTYAFQRRRFWLTPTPTGDLTRTGLTGTGHPLLAAAVTVPDTDTTVYTGQLSAHSHPWISDHLVHDRVVLPGTAHLDLALHAGHHHGHPHLDELTLHAPLTLTDTPTTIHLTLGPDDGTGRRPVTIHTHTGGTWTRHATGTLSTTTPPPPSDLTTWPPPGAEPIDTTDAYRRLSERGYGYGPAFQGLRAAWRDRGHVYAEVDLPDGVDPDEHTVHPALLDAAMHADLLVDDGPTLMPFVWNGVTAHATGASTVRVRITRIRGDEVSAIDIADADGAPVLSVASLVSRPTTAEQVAAPCPWPPTRRRSGGRPSDPHPTASTSPSTPTWRRSPPSRRTPSCCRCDPATPATFRGTCATRSPRYWRRCRRGWPTTAPPARGWWC